MCNQNFNMNSMEGEQPFNSFQSEVEHFNDSSVEDFVNDYDPDYNDYDPDYNDYDPDYFGNKKKRAERKLVRAEKKLEKGKTKAAARLQRKAGKVLDKVSAGQAQQVMRKEQLSNINIQQADFKAASPLSSEPVTEVAAGARPSMDYGISSNTGIESEAALTSITANDEPTGDLAKEKQLENVTVYSRKKNKSNTMLFIIIGAAVIIAAFFYFKSKK